MEWHWKNMAKKDEVIKDQKEIMDKAAKKLQQNYIDNTQIEYHKKENEKLREQLR